jgi:hypothetical protein
MRDRLRRRLLSGPLPVSNGLLAQSRLGQMPGEHLGLVIADLGKTRLQHVRDARVKVLPPGFEQRLVGGVLDQRVLKGVGRLGHRATAKHQFRGDQLIEGVT